MGEGRLCRPTVRTLLARNTRQRFERKPGPDGIRCTAVLRGPKRAMMKIKPYLVDHEADEPGRPRTSGDCKAVQQGAVNRKAFSKY